MDRSLPEPADQSSVRYWFAGLRLEADGTLLRAGMPPGAESQVTLPAQELAVLRLLLTRAGEVVSLRELGQALSGDASSSCVQLSRSLASLRLHLQPADCVESVYKRGYRISAPVQSDPLIPPDALPRLAILPFATGFSVPDYLGMAIAENTMEMLAGASDPVASIVARDSVFTLARRGLPAQQMGSILQADLLLAGLLHQNPGRLRLRAELTRVSDGAQLWVEDLLARPQNIGESREAPQEIAQPGDASARSDIPGLTLELVNRLTTRLQSGGLSISAVAAPVPAAESAPSPLQTEALHLFLRAHHDWQSLERHRMQDAMGRLIRAVELDPSLIAARIDLAHISLAQALFGFISPRSAAALVHRAAERIPDLNGNLNAQAVSLLPAVGWVDLYFDHDLPSALRAFARSAHLPHDPWRTRARGQFLLSRHRFAEALQLFRAALSLDPWSPWLHAALAWTQHLAGEAGLSLAQIRKTIEMFPEYEGALVYGAIILAFNGEAAQAVELSELLAARSPHFDIAMAAHAYALACAGDASQARALLERLQWLSRERFVLNTFNAAVHVALGEPDAALGELRTSLEIRSPWFFQTLADPRLKPLHGRTEFAAMTGILAQMEAEASVLTQQFTS